VDQSWAKLSWIPDVWIPRAEVTEVQAVRGLMGPGILFRSATGAFDGVIFWTFSAAEVLGTLRRFGWPVA